MQNKRFVSLIAIVLLLITPVWASKRILVDLTHQIAIAYQDGKVKFYGRISSGKPGHETPTGHFYVREKDIHHVSNLWPMPNGGARMPYMLRITHDGVAMHLGPTPDYPASHGCIRMRSGFAQRMYAWASKYTKVDVVGRAPAHSPAVALPAYARSARVLRRSIGSSAAGPLAALSSNPKDHDLTSFASSAHRSTRRGRTRRARHLHPLQAISGDTAHTSRASARKSRHRKLRRKSRRRHRHRSRRHRSRHLDPLKAVSH
jgi:hypothetical protein